MYKRIMKAIRYVTEYLVLPFPEIQPDYWLKIVLWKHQNEYLPTVYVRDAFRLPQTSLCSKRQHRKRYYVWVEDQWGIFPEDCTIKDMQEDKVIDTVLEVIKCNMLKMDISPHIKSLLNHYDENL